MSEVKRYSEGRFSGSGIEHAQGCWVRYSDFDRVTAERDAALDENKLLRHDVASYLETVAKVCDMLGVDLESAKTAEGKPSDVLFDYVSAMQQRLTAADERADVLEVALAGMLFAFDDGVGLDWSEDLLDFARKLTAAEEFKAALKPAESAPCCMISAGNRALLEAGDYTPEELFGVGGKPSCPKCAKP